MARKSLEVIVLVLLLCCVGWMDCITDRYQRQLMMPAGEHHQHPHDRHHMMNGSSAHHRRSHKHAMKYGAPGLLPKISLHGAIIVSDRGVIATTVPANEEEAKKQLIAQARTQNVENLANELPFPVTEWAAVFTLPCPLYPSGHRTERGLIWAHYRIFREFAFFDPILLHQVGYQPGQKPNISHVVSSRDGLYSVYPNGTLVKNGLPFLDDDIITIFEDDAESAIKNLNITIVEEFAQMNTDILFLGWCEGRTARPVPLCAHAYALTRRSARKLTALIELCGMAIDEQFVLLAKNNLLTWRRANAHSYKELNEKYKNKWGEKTYGIFHQNKDLGSINGHRRSRRLR